MLFSFLHIFISSLFISNYLWLGFRAVMNSDSDITGLRRIRHFLNRICKMYRNIVLGIRISAMMYTACKLVYILSSEKLVHTEYPLGKIPGQEPYAPRYKSIKSQFLKTVCFRRPYSFSPKAVQVLQKDPYQQYYHKSHWKK